MDFAGIQYITVTILSGATTSDEAAMPAGATLIAVGTPAALTSTALTFTAATVSGGTFKAVYDESTAYSLTVSTSRHVAVKPSVFAGVKFLKVVGGSSEGADRSITLVVRNV